MDTFKSIGYDKFDDSIEERYTPHLENNCNIVTNEHTEDLSTDTSVLGDTNEFNDLNENDQYHSTEEVDKYYIEYNSNLNQEGKPNQSTNTVTKLVMSAVNSETYNQFLLEEGLDTKKTSNIDDNLQCNIEDKIGNNEPYHDKDNDYNREDHYGYSGNNRSFNTIELYSSNSYQNNRQEKRFIDSVTMNSYNNISDLKKDRQIRHLKKGLEYNQNILKNNIDKMHDREWLISNVNDKTEKLLDSSSRFKKTSKQLKNKMLFYSMCHIVGLLTTITVIVVVVMTLNKN